MVSIITPTHNTKYLARLYESIKKQTIKDFEWVVVPNNGADVSFLPKEDWIRIVPYDGDSKLIGSIKNFAFKQGQRDWLAEVDHDDEIFPNCIEEVQKCINNNPSCDFIYSDTAELKESGQSSLYNKDCGWQFYDFEHDGITYPINKSFQPTPQSVSKIWYAPNHIRVWKRKFYHNIGGHNIELKALDDQELLCRTYLQGRMVKIEKVLYKYNFHENNSYSSKELNAWIQQQTLVFHKKYIGPMMEKWSTEKNLLKLNISSGDNNKKDCINFNLSDKSVLSLFNGETWPFEDNSVGVIYAHDALEHLSDKMHTMQEIYRVLASGGMLLSQTPSTDGRGAFQDPTHVSYWNSNSFWYYTRAQMANFVNSNVRFQATYIENEFPSEWHKTHNILYVTANLTALKSGEEQIYFPGKTEI